MKWMNKRTGEMDGFRNTWNNIYNFKLAAQGGKMYKRMSLTLINFVNFGENCVKGKVSRSESSPPLAVDTSWLPFRLESTFSPE